MKYIKIKIVEYRDNTAHADLQQAAAELNQIITSADASRREATEIEDLAKQSNLASDIALAEAEKEKSGKLSSSVLAAKMKVKYLSQSSTKRAFDHAMVGTFGYQEIDSATMTVVRLLDESGQPYPRDAIFGYEVVDVEPPMPAWGIPDTEPSPVQPVRSLS